MKMLGKCNRRLRINTCLDCDGAISKSLKTINKFMAKRLKENVQLKHRNIKMDRTWAEILNYFLSWSQKLYRLQVGRTPNIKKFWICVPFHLVFLSFMVIINVDMNIAYTRPERELHKRAKPMLFPRLNKEPSKVHSTFLFSVIQQSIRTAKYELDINHVALFTGIIPDWW